MGSSRDNIPMCPPDHFTADYIINPWMAGDESSLDIDRARRQWTELRDAIAEYAEVVEMEPAPDLPDMVFTANAGAVYGTKAIASHLVNVGDMVFLNEASDPLKARLMLAGFRVKEVNLSEFLKAGGSAKCLTLKLTEPVLQ